MHRHPRLALALALAACSAAGDDPSLPPGTSTDTSGSPPGPPPEPSTGPPPTPTTTLPEPGTTGEFTTGEPPGATASGSGDESGVDAGPPPTCGDGELQFGEECDLGHGVNADDGMCTLGCTLAQCGDGLVWDGVEACDAGDDYSEDQYGGCTQTCKKGPHCGDGIVQDVEQCDLGPANGSGEHPLDGVPCRSTCFHDAALVFLSSEAYSPQELNGLLGADQRCEELAEKAGLHAPETFRAWLSYKLAGPRDHFPKATPGKPYALLTGHRVADDRAQLLATGPLIALAVTETGQTLYNKYVWTNVQPDGTAFDPAQDCDEWSSADPLLKARVGHSGVDKALDPDGFQAWRTEGYWTSAVNFGCDNEYRLFCFEEHDPELP